MEPHKVDLDALREMQAMFDDRLEADIRLNHELLHEVYTGRTKSSLWRLVAKLVAGSFALLTTIILIGAFLGANGSEPQFLWSGLVLDLLAIAAFIATNAQIGLALGIDYSKPVSVIQKRIQLLRKFRVRYGQIIFLLMMLTWAPVFIVVLKAFFDMDAYLLYGSTWIAWTVGFGVVAFFLGVWLSVRLRRAAGASSAGRQFIDSIAGHELSDANRLLRELCEFEQEKIESGNEDIG